MSLHVHNFHTAMYTLIQQAAFEATMLSKTSHNAMDQCTVLLIKLDYCNSTRLALTRKMMSGAPDVLVEQRPGDECLPARAAVEPLPRVHALVHLERALLAERLAAV